MTDQPTAAAVAPRRRALPARVLWTGLALIVAAQALLGFMGVADLWTRGHNGWNGGAYHLGARNTLRWGFLFPLQYDAGVTPPPVTETYTHHPLAMHMHDTASLWLFGDHPAAIRGVAALHGVLAVVMLFLLVRRYWSDVHALVAASVYVVLPINAIYINMANHSSGFIFWSLLALYCYLGWRRKLEADEKGGRWLAATLGAFLLAAQWDWPAYYVAFGMAVHWLVAGLGRLRRMGRPFWKWDRDLGSLVLFSLLVLASFGGHFLLVDVVTGNVGELEGTFQERQNVSWAKFRDHLKVVPELMFTWPVLALSAGWILTFLYRLVRGRAHARDVVPMVYAYGGAIHYWMFKWSAIVHSYWAWTMLPFVALACATSVVGAGQWIAARAEPRWGRRVAVALAAPVGLLLVPLAVRAADIVPPARHVGGSMWWVAPVRGPVADDYRSGRPELRFAEKVRGWTERSTGVQVHRSILVLNPEPRFNTHLDRERMDVRGLVGRAPVRRGVDGWVLIGRRPAVHERRLLRLAARHPYWQYGDFFMVDLRRRGPDVRIWKLEPEDPSLAWSYFVSPFENPVRARRAPGAEQTMRDRIARLADRPR